MKLQQLFKTYTFDDIMPIIADMFPGTGKHRASLEEAYNTLMQLTPITSKKEIRYKVIKDTFSSDSFIGAEDADFNTTWEVCLGKEVTKDNGVDLSDIELAANCLVNICFLAKHPKSFEQTFQKLQKR